MNMFYNDTSKSFFGAFGVTCLPCTLIISLSVFVLAPVEGQIQVIGSDQPIIASPGDDVLLPCVLQPKSDVRTLTVEWSKLDPKPDHTDQQTSIVHRYRHRHEEPGVNQSYLGRVKLFTDGLKEGNMSLLIKNVTLTDNGRYRCFIPKLESGSKESVVALVVNSNYVTIMTPLHLQLQTPDPTRETDVKGHRHHLVLVGFVGFVGFVLIIVLVGVGAARCFRNKDNDSISRKPLPV